MNKILSGIGEIVNAGNIPARIDAVRKLAASCDTACELLSVAAHIGGLTWPDSADTTVDRILRDRAIEITGVGADA